MKKPKFKKFKKNQKVKNNNWSGKPKLNIIEEGETYVKVKIDASHLGFGTVQVPVPISQFN